MASKVICKNGSHLCHLIFIGYGIHGSRDHFQWWSVMAQRLGDHNSKMSYFSSPPLWFLGSQGLPLLVLRTGRRHMVSEIELSAPEQTRLLHLQPFDLPPWLQFSGFPPHFWVTLNSIQGALLILWSGNTFSGAWSRYMVLGIKSKSVFYKAGTLTPVLSLLLLFFSLTSGSQFLEPLPRLLSFPLYFLFPWLNSAMRQNS